LAVLLRLSDLSPALPSPCGLVAEVLRVSAPGDCSLRSSSRHRRLTDSSLGRVNRSSGFDPQAAWPGRKVRQYGCYGSDRVADRPSALHAEALRRRGWGTRLAPSIRAGELLPDRRPPEPLFASAASPEFPLGLALKAWLVHQVPTRFHSSKPQLPLAEPSVFSGLAALRVAPPG
jgi:hypothetical protein